MLSGPRKAHDVVEMDGTWPASSVRTHWRDIVADANTNGEVVVTHHNRAEVMVVSMARYEQLQRKAKANEALTALRAEFDREMAVLRRPGAAEKLRQLSTVTPAEIAEAANAAVARRKKSRAR
jgi:prevent-host-death family protein